MCWNRFLSHPGSVLLNSSQVNSSSIWVAVKMARKISLSDAHEWSVKTRLESRTSMVHARTHARRHTHIHTRTHAHLEKWLPLVFVRYDYVHFWGFFLFFWDGLSLSDFGTTDKHLQTWQDLFSLSATSKTLYLRDKNAFVTSFWSCPQKEN